MIHHFTTEMVVEIPCGTNNKYEYDPARRRFRLDRVLPGAQVYPGEYGYIAATLDFDGDPLDAIVLISARTFPGCIIDIRVLGTIHMIDEGQIDTKLFGVVANDVRFRHLTDIKDVNPDILSQITDFFSSYKKLQGGRVEITKIGNAHDAETELKSAQNRYQRYQKIIAQNDKQRLMQLLAREQRQLTTNHRR